MLEAPVAYQGGKTRIAGTIADAILAESGGRLGPILDLCCGCGAVSVELVNRGVARARISMVDSGPWGLFWQMVGAGTFDLDKFREVVARVPADPRLVKGHLERLAAGPAGDDAPYVFLLLQAGSFGGKPVSVRDGRWVAHGFRSFWSPTATSNRRSHVNPMMPMPGTLLARVERLTEMRGVSGSRADVDGVRFRPGDVVYVDPPYESFTGYSSTFDVAALARRAADAGAVCLVSEGRPLEGGDARLISAPRKKGGISGARTKANEEWLTVFRPS